MKSIFLELFSGTKTMSKVACEYGYNVFNIDINGSLNPTLTADILTLSAADIIDHCGGRPTVIWASPDCTKWSYANGADCEFTEARKYDPKSQEAIEAIDLITHTIKLIQDLAPKYHFIENPFHGALKNQPFISKLPFVDIYYCAYEWQYQKKTRIWGNFPPGWIARTTCNHTQHDNIKGAGNARTRSEIPPLLAREICAATKTAELRGHPQRMTLEDFI